MNNNIKEMFLSEYFKHVAALGAFCDKATFDRLAKVFALSTADASALWTAIGREEVADIVTPDDANRYMRILQFGEISNIDLSVPEESKDLISIKTKAFADMAVAKLCAERNATSSQVSQTLYTHALQGCLSAMYIWGALQCDGNAALCVEKDLEQGVLLLEKAAHWGHIPSILSLLNYLSDADNNACHIKHSAKYYRKMLGTFVCNTPYGELLHLLDIKQSERSPNAQLLLELLAHRRINANVFDQSFAKVVYGDTIGAAAKKKLLAETDAKFVSELAALPMHLSHRPLDANEQLFDNLPFVHREAEQSHLRAELTRLGEFFFEQRKPLCLCCDDRFVLDAYIRDLEGLESDSPKPQHVAVIDVGELTEADLQPTESNVFVANCKNNAHNLYLLVLRGNIASDRIAAVRDFLQVGKRTRFKLCQPSVTLDLGSVSPVCFCDRQNADKLFGVVNIGVLSPLSAEERQGILQQRIQDVRTRHADAMPCVNDRDIELLSHYPPDVALIALDKLYFSGANGNEAKDIAFYIAEAQKCRREGRDYGFGGYSK